MLDIHGRRHKLRACRVCGKPVARYAKACPHCGCEWPGESVIGLILMVIVCAALFFGFLFWFLPNEKRIEAWIDQVITPASRS